MTGKRLKGSWRGPISLLLGWVQMVSAEAAHSCREQVQGQTDAALGLGRRLEAGRKLVFPSSKQQHAKERGGGRAAFRWRRNSSVTLHFRSMMGRWKMNLLQPVLSDVSELWDLSAVRPEKNKLNKKLSQPSFPNLCIIECQEKWFLDFSVSFFSFSLLLLDAFPFLSLDSWRESRWLLFLWLHAECNGERLANGFLSSQTQWWWGAVHVLGEEGFLWTEMAEAMAVWAFRAFSLCIFPLSTSKPSTPFPSLCLLSRASLFRWVPPHKAVRSHWWIQLAPHSN